MELTVGNGTPAGYTAMLRKLLPPGDYWDAQIQDAASDINLVLSEKAEWLSGFRKRMNQLLKEAYPGTAEETISDWERIYLGYTNGTCPLEQRRGLLHVQKADNTIIESLKSLAETYGAAIKNVYYPYQSAFCGHSFFGRSFMATPAVLSVLFIQAAAPENVRPDFESAIEQTCLANQILFFFYGDEQ